MNDVDLLAFILRVMKSADAADLDVRWCVRNDGPHAWVNCNDLFEWATADGEEITPENVSEWERAIADVKAADPVFGVIYADSLFACRVRRMRPQGAAYPKDRPHLWPLFDACGPERGRDGNNPERPGERRKWVAIP